MCREVIQPRDMIVMKLNAWRDDEVIIREPLTFPCDQGVRLRTDLHHRILHPCDAIENVVLLSSDEIAWAKDATSNERLPGLVEVRT